MGHDESLHARNDVALLRVVLRDRLVADQMWRALAEVWRERPDLVTAQLDMLADVLPAPAGAWDEAVASIEGELQLPEAEAELSPSDAYRLACELKTAADSTLRSRVAPLSAFPHQQDRWVA
ncbi:hypothetical protein OG455_41880 [Kitasatospora sp. NBC_01287]|uniref:hypothetical protein n=1 Tax=Kitasatospora sp. NBC_01287 TaxID=2903573 RepID=UPI00225606F8|nr:hypothetical protein [Kitasatospora sp. NBC_01287]MCX4751713.1 hypothetical protein [Kitasatospora sp. NBC_01287]MCX4751995.1 hypothetical protein [Kitasatospora sp. NBC_01287]